MQRTSQIPGDYPSISIPCRWREDDIEAQGQATGNYPED